MRENITAIAPAKLILSGEHSVLYGAPALAMAVNRVAETTLLWQPEQQHSIAFYLLNLDYTASLTVQKLHDLKQRIQNKYEQFLKGECTIREVLQRSFELLQYAFIYIVDRFDITLPPGLAIRSHSNIPMGCGMGSSAATIVSVMCALSALWELDMQVDHYLQCARAAEHLHHGHSSGLDLYLAIHGGCVRFDEEKAASRTMPVASMFLVNTGEAKTSTGESVSYAARYFNNSKTLTADFAAVTEAFDSALQTNDQIRIKECIRANHRLLAHIGVVPQKAQKFIAAIEKLGGAAKVCGAGASRGESAGVMLVMVDADISSLVKKHDYEMFPLKGNESGMQIV